MNKKKIILSMIMVLFVVGSLLLRFLSPDWAASPSESLWLYLGSLWLYLFTLTSSEMEEIDQVLPVDWMQEKYTNGRLKLALLWDSDNSKIIAEHPTMEILNNDFVIRMGENR